MVEPGQCLKCATSNAEPGLCVDCGRIRGNPFERSIVRGPDGWHYVKVGIALLLLVDGALFLVSRTSLPQMNSGEPVVIAELRRPASDNSSSRYRLDLIKQLGSKMYWDSKYEGGNATIIVNAHGDVRVPSCNCRSPGQFRINAEKLQLSPPPSTYMKGSTYELTLYLDELRPFCVGDISSYRKSFDDMIKSAGLDRERIVVTFGRDGNFLGFEPAFHHEVLGGDLVFKTSGLRMPEVPGWWPAETISLGVDTVYYGRAMGNIAPYRKVMMRKIAKALGPWKADYESAVLSITLAKDGSVLQSSLVDPSQMTDTLSKVVETCGTTKFDSLPDWFKGESLQLKIDLRKAYNTRAAN